MNYPIGVLCTKQYFDYHYKGLNNYVCICKKQDAYGKYFSDIIFPLDENIRNSKNYFEIKYLLQARIVKN